MYKYTINDWKTYFIYNKKNTSKKIGRILLINKSTVIILHGNTTVRQDKMSTSSEDQNKAREARGQLTVDLVFYDDGCSLAGVKPKN